MKIKLITRVEPDQEVVGKTHGDALASIVERFCGKYHFPFSQTFTCVFVYGETEDHNAAGGQLGYGLAYRLNEEVVIPKLAIVCTDDIQNVARNALANERDQNNLKTYLRMFTDLSRFTTLETKREALVRALDRRSGPYVEARMLQPLAAEDVLGPA